MNRDRYSRVTLVLDRGTDEGLAYLSQRLRRSKSELVREVLEEPVKGMVGMLQRFPEGGEIDPRQLAIAGLDLIDGALAEPVAMLEALADGAR